MESMATYTNFKLHNGVEIPAVGLGTFGIKGDNVASTLKCAFKAGYRLIDTAAVYRNENDIGGAINSELPALGLDRTHIFITTKLSARDHGPEASTSALQRSLQSLGTGYIDLFLIHWPGAKGYKHDDPKHRELRRQTWIQLEKLYLQGLVKAIGVSNYTAVHLKETLAYCTVKPMVNQVEFHPHLVQNDLLQFCRQENIHLQSFSTLGGGNTDQVREDPVVKDIAQKYDMTPAQALLKWAIQQGISVIPKSMNPDHLISNLMCQSLGPLSGEDINRLNALNKSLRYCNLNPELVL